MRMQRLEVGCVHLISAQHLASNQLAVALS